MTARVIYPTNQLLIAVHFAFHRSFIRNNLRINDKIIQINMQYIKNRL